MKTVFFGTPAFAVPTLAAMVESGYAPSAVISQPSRPAGRGRALREPPVAAWARQQGLAVHQPETVRNRDFLAMLEALAPDVAVVVAYGQIFRKRLLRLPRLGCVNLHGSLLPRYRGAAPIQWSLAHGDRETGVTTMQMTAGLDSGPILLQATTAVGEQETTPELAERLAAIGAPLMVETLDRLAEGTIEAREQDVSQVTFAPRLDKADGEIDWGRTARALFDRWRGFTPWPGLSARLGAQPLKVLALRPAEDGDAGSAAPGTIVDLRGDAVAVACGDGTIAELLRVQRPGRGPLAAADWLRGERLRAGATFDAMPPDPPTT